MSYEPTNWQNGDTITAEKLNKMESGIAENDGYWIPLEFTAGVFSVPADKQNEVELMLINESRYIRGCRISTGTDISGYRVAHAEFHCPFSSAMAADLGIYGLGNLVVKYVDDDGVVVEVVPDVFVVTLTPTAQDFSGVMDKTVGEIASAFNAGRRCIFRLSLSATDYYEGDVVRGATSSGVSYNTYAFVVSGILTGVAYIYTGVGSSDSSTAYYTTLFPLTPMS